MFFFALGFEGRMRIAHDRAGNGHLQGGEACRVRGL